MTVYMDVVFMMNLLMDYILLQVTGRVCACRKKRWRCLMSAAVGAFFSCGILYIPAGKNLPVRILAHGICTVIMLRIGLGLKRDGLLQKGICTMYLTAFLAGGVRMLFGSRKMKVVFFVFLAAAIYFGLSAILCGNELWQIRRRKVYPITLFYQGKVHTSYGFFDTGNMLMDPVSGKPVSIIEPDLLEELLPEKVTEQLRHLPEKAVEWKDTELNHLQPHFLIYETIGERGLLLAVTLEKLCIQTPGEMVHVEKPVFALLPEASSLEKEYKVILNSSLLDFRFLH